MHRDHQARGPGPVPQMSRTRIPLHDGYRSTPAHPVRTERVSSGDRRPDLVSTRASSCSSSSSVGSSPRPNWFWWCGGASAQRARSGLVAAGARGLDRQTPTASCPP